MTAEQPHGERPPADEPTGDVDEPVVAEPTESNLAGGEAGSAGEAPEAAGTAEGAPAAGGSDGAGDAGADQASADELAVTRMELAERTADLQRLQAEFVNYKRRVERDRELLAQNASYKVLAPVVEVLDTIDRAREHAPLEGGLMAVADQLERVVGAQGLTKFGEPGDPFDPNLHEALSILGTDPEVSVQTVKVVAKAGYRLGDRVVRAAQVLVVDPE
ncbi:nucleotide exchange factor GrpE [Nocardioides sp. CPCC 205120]|uniref:nucleotide exchange factor GrpE n=1 Tax=Nocardioides sp. CPCC 205120 TaxID=3406462 RepID=UPI003B5058FE